MKKKCCKERKRRKSRKRGKYNFLCACGAECTLICLSLCLTPRAFFDQLSRKRFEREEKQHKARRNVKPVEDKNENCVSMTVVACMAIFYIIIVSSRECYDKNFLHCHVLNAHKRMFRKVFNCLNIFHNNGLCAACCL